MDPLQERNTILALLQAESARLLPVLNPRLVPPEGISFGFAMRGARDGNGVAAVTGGLVSRPAGAAAGPCAFGTDEPVVRVILTAMKFDPEMRSAAMLAHSHRALRILHEDLFLECRKTPPSRNPGISSMDWGIAACCRNGIPDMILLRGAAAPDSRIILFGEDPAAVSNNIIICSNRI